MVDQTKQVTLFYKFKEIITLVQAITIITFVVLYFADIRELSFGTAANSIYLLCVIILVQYIWSIWSWSTLTKSSFDLYVVFLTAAYLFNAGQAFLEIFGLNHNGILYGQFSANEVFDTLYLTATCLATLHFGAIFSVKPNRMSVEEPRPSKSIVKRIDMAIVGSLLLAVSSIFTLQQLYQRLQVVALSGYSELYRGEVVTGAENAPAILASFFVPGCLFLLAGSRQRKVIIIISSFVLLYASVYFVTGQRGWNLLFLLGYAWLFNKTVKPIPKSVAIGIAILLLFLIPLVRIVRNIPTLARPDIGDLIQEQVNTTNPMVESISEMGGSMRTITYTLDLVPRERDFSYGMTYIYAMTTALPNFTDDVHPAILHANLGKWLTERVAPSIFRKGGGLGFSFIAEAYLNFGWLGAGIFMLFLGSGLARFTLRFPTNRDMSRLTLVACIMSFLPFMTRADTVTVSRAIFWYSLFPYLGVQILARINRKIVPSEE